MRSKPFGTITPHKDAEVVDTERLEGVKLSAKTLPVTADPLRCKDSPIPEVGSHITVDGVSDIELAILNGHKRTFRLSINYRLFPAGTSSEHCGCNKKRCQESFVHNTYFSGIE